MAAFTVIDDTNYKTLLGDGTSIIAGGDRRLLSAMPRPANADVSGYSKPFKPQFGNVPRSEWPARVKELEEKRMRISDLQKFAPHDQDGLPTCWANGPAHAMTTARVIQGLPLVYISACSAAVPISGGHSGGWEGDALELFTQRGGVSTELWPNNSTDRSLNKDPKCEADRLNHKSIEAYDCESFDDFFTALLLGFPCAVAYNWWSHVVSLADPVMIESGSYGLRIRNNWGSWGDKNEAGFYGYQVLREGKGTPSSGFALRTVTSSVA